MTLTRVTGKVFAGDADLDELGVFGSAKSGNPTNPTGTNIESQLQSGTAYEKGWGDAVVTEQNFPPMEEVNGVLRTISYQNCYLLQEGIPSYDSGTTYSDTSIVKTFSGNNEVLFYRSIQDNNINHSLSDTAYWQKVNFEYDPYSIDGQWVYKKELLFSNAAANPEYTRDLTTYLGVDSNSTTQYEILFAHTYYAGTSSARKGVVYSDVVSDYTTTVSGTNYGSMATTDQGRTTGYIATIPVIKTMYMKLPQNFTTNILIALGYRRLGTNQ